MLLRLEFAKARVEAPEDKDYWGVYHLYCDKRFEAAGSGPNQSRVLINECFGLLDAMRQIRLSGQKPENTLSR